MDVFQDITSMGGIFRAIAARENKFHGICVPFSLKHECRHCRTVAEWRTWNGFAYLRSAGVRRPNG